MRILPATENFSVELKEFMCAAIQRRRDDDGFRGYPGRKSRNATDQDSDAAGNRLVCVTGGVSYLGRAIVKRLLIHGYTVRIVVDCPEDKEKVSEMETEADDETTSFRNRITSVVSRLTEIESLVKAFDGCAGVFHTAAFVDPAGISGYSKSMAELEAKVSENVIEACTRTMSVRKCVFTSSLLASAWQNNILDNYVINEESWSNEQLCIDKKLWYALGKLRAEKAAWRIAETKGLKLATICPALINGPDFFHRNSTSTLAYLKGAKEMYSNGLLATIDVNRLAKAHVSIWEGLGDKTAFGRYICVDTILSKDGAEKLAKDIGVQMEKICGSSRSSSDTEEEEEETSSPNLQVSNKKILDLMSRTLRSCYHES